MARPLGPEDVTNTCASDERILRRDGPGEASTLALPAVTYPVDMRLGAQEEIAPGDSRRGHQADVQHISGHDVEGRPRVENGGFTLLIAKVEVPIGVDG